MNARDALDWYIEALQILARSGKGDRSDKQRQVDAQHRTALIDSYTHGLAERQRAALDDLFERYERTFHEDAFTELINVIDPKAQRAETTGDNT